MTDAKSAREPALPLRWLKRLWGLIRGYFAFIGFLVTIGPMLLVWLLSGPLADSHLPMSKRPPMAEKTSLSVHLHGSLSQKQPDFFERTLAKLTGEEYGLYLPEFRKLLKRAAVDANVTGLHVQLGSLSGSMADIADLRRILLEFKAAGKTVEVLLHDGSDWTYYLASLADRITLNPATALTIPGPLFQLMYFAEGLKKLGVQMQVVRVGKYKSAFEPFVEDAPSEATLEEYRSMEASLRDHLVSTIAAGRNKPEAEVRGWFKRSIFTPDDALKAGIVDALGYGPVDAGYALDDYADDTASDPDPEAHLTVHGEGGIALVEAVGEIRMEPSQSGLQDDGIAPASLTRELRWAAKAKDVKAVVLRISSPGGSAVASDIIWGEVQSLAKTKPVVVSMGAYAASGGYYIAAPAHKLYAEPTTITGSIGVIGAMPRLGAFKEKYGVSFHVVTQSDRQALLDLAGAPTSEDQALLDGTLGAVYQTFVSKVAEGRKMPLAEVEVKAQGRVYTGLQAKTLGLVDEIGGLADAFSGAKELAGFDKNKRYPLLRYQPDEFDLTTCMESREAMMRCLGQGGASLGAALPLLSRALRGEGVLMPWPHQASLRAARWLQTWQEPGPSQALMLWPGYLTLNLR